MNVSAGGNDFQANTVGWSGPTIKEILEKVDLFNISTLIEHDDDDDVKKENKDKDMTATQVNPESAFLGPKLWSKSISVPSALGDDCADDFSVMNIDDFLIENGFDIDEHNQAPTSPSDSNQSSALSPMSSTCDDPMDVPPVVQAKKRPASREESGRKSNLSKCDNTFLYVESKRARMEKEREERKRKSEMEAPFTPQDLALATVPGVDFDPRNRAFAPDELRPQPIIRKRRKSYVAQEKKDDKYWEKRVKNNVAARRSREARRLKENQIALRTAFLERENATLKAQYDEIKSANIKLAAEKQHILEKLQQYETGLD